MERTFFSSMRKLLYLGFIIYLLRYRNVAAVRLVAMVQLTRIMRPDFHPLPRRHVLRTTRPTFAAMATPASRHWRLSVRRPAWTCASSISQCSGFRGHDTTRARQRRIELSTRRGASAADDRPGDLNKCSVSTRQPPNRPASVDEASRSGPRPQTRIAALATVGSRRKYAVAMLALIASGRQPSHFGPGVVEGAPGSVPG